MKKSKKVFSFLDVSIIVIMSSFVMCFLGATLVYKHLGGVNFSLLGEDQNLKDFIGAYNNLLDNYYDTLDKRDLIEGAIEGMYEVTGDPYTTYLDPETSNYLDKSLNGKYIGIGIQTIFTPEEKLIVTDVFSDTPAEKVGMKKDDVITKVGDLVVTKENYESLLDSIKNSKEEKLTINRNGTEYMFTVSATTINQPALETLMFERNGKKVGYLKLKVFSDTADIQFGTELTKLESVGMDSLIIDLRNNTGGYLQVAENIAEIFLEKGKTIYSLENKNENIVTKDETNEKKDYKIAILINKGSASASEILAGALKYSYGATLVGKTSYGKGKVQERSTLTSGTTLKYTTAKWLLPNGICIDKIGLDPDIEVEIDVENHDVTNIYTDTQVMKALENLAG